MKKLRSLSIFFPTFNDAKILPQFINKAYETGLKVAESFEVIVVNDGSTDDTQSILEKFKKKYTNLRIVQHEKNLGYGAALTSGFKNARKEWVFYTDGDGQYDPKELELLIKALQNDIDVVNGYKLSRSDPFLRKYIGSLYSWFLHMMYNLPIRDVDCDFRLIKHSVLDKIHLSSTSGIICLELVIKLKKAGASFKEIGVHHYKRPFGSSRFFTPKNVAKTLYDNVVFYLQYKFN